MDGWIIAGGIVLLGFAYLFWELRKPTTITIETKQQGSFLASLRGRCSDAAGAIAGKISLAEKIKDCANFFRW